MIVGCYSGNIDLIITKSISRFGRNTLEMLEVLNELKSLGVDGRLIINHKEGIIVQEIFHLYLRGDSLRQISSNLNLWGIITPRGLEKWSVETINKLLSNEKYTGNVLLQKSIVNDFFSGKQVINQGQVEKYFISGSNPAIISEEQFNKVQLEKKYRRTAKIKNS